MGKNLRERERERERENTVDRKMGKVQERQGRGEGDLVHSNAIHRQQMFSLEFVVPTSQDCTAANLAFGGQFKCTNLLSNFEAFCNRIFYEIFSNLKI
jgi:hypothetical protein